jgi:spore coat polysaccharide biosynthesis predicted glycosyltransferase SpsG
MHQADIVFTSAGRTVYEIASIGTPMIVLAQNHRELQHTFARSDNGIINLGLGTDVADAEIESTLTRLMKDVSLRQKCHRLMLKNDLRGGVETVLKTIFSKFEETKGKKPR